MNENDARAGESCSLKPRSRLARWLWLGGALVALLAVFVLGGVAGQYVMASPGMAFGMGGHGCMFRGGRHPFPPDPAVARERARFAAEWVLRSVDATDEQKERVGTIVGGLTDDLLATVPEHRKNREAFLAALAGDTVDRAALEAIRTEELRVIDRASARVADALAETAAVLTPEQRATLLEAVERFHR